uniref:Uncharacterized protein n=1 Tax=Pygocentrus nattereri TaxID=42514 RepID=A0AAR2KQA7_PYGNA
PPWTTHALSIRLTHLRSQSIWPCRYLDTSTPAFAYSIWYCSTRRINHRHETNKAQVLSREVNIICVELEALWKLFLRKAEVAKSWW